jgi:hypothetical protein
MTRKCRQGLLVAKTGALHMVSVSYWNLYAHVFFSLEVNSILLKCIVWSWMRMCVVEFDLLYVLANQCIITTNLYNVQTFSLGCFFVFSYDGLPSSKIGDQCATPLELSGYHNHVADLLAMHTKLIACPQFCLCDKVMDLGKTSTWRLSFTRLSLCTFTCTLNMPY